LLQRGLTGAEILWTVSGRRVQSLNQQEVTAQMSLGPSCPGHPFSVEPGNTEIPIWIWGVLALEASPNLVRGPIPPGERVESLFVSPL
jgi:hypothetical protein